MQKQLVKLICIFVAGGFLISCTSIQSVFNGRSSKSTSSGKSDLGDQPASMTGRPTNQSTAVGGKFDSRMDGLDKSKLPRALDAGLGKATTWTNGSSGITYTVVPTRKVTIGGNQFCRSYSITAVRGGDTDQYTGTACLGDDSNWHPI